MSSAAGGLTVPGLDGAAVIVTGGGPVGLSQAGLVQRDVTLALEPPLGVPYRLAVPEQDQPDPFAQRILPGLTTSSGSGIWGQSFQIRSSA